MKALKRWWARLTCSHPQANEFDREWHCGACKKSWSNTA
jgi:hypothetical protein